MPRSKKRGDISERQEPNTARIFQQLSNDISEESKILNQYRSSCKEELLELSKLPSANRVTNNGM